MMRVAGSAAAGVVLVVVAVVVYVASLETAVESFVILGLLLPSRRW